MTRPLKQTGLAPLFDFDSAFLQRLEGLALLTRRPLQGPTAGPRRSQHHGSSVEFADFRDYSPGDDIRRVDWKAFARLDRLFLRLYTAEEMTTVTLLLDHSASMSFGQPSKSATAARLAAVISYIALHNYDRVAVAGWGSSIDRYLPPQSGKGAVHLVWRFIAELTGTPPAGHPLGAAWASPARQTDLSTLRGYSRSRHGPGLAIVLSDLLTDSDWQGGLRGLRAGGHEVTVIQVLAPDELQPALRGDWKLRDVESGAAVEVTISPRLLRRYQEELAAHTAAIRDFCRRQGMVFVQIASDVSVTDVVLRDLRRAGVVA